MRATFRAEDLKRSIPDLMDLQNCPVIEEPRPRAFVNAPSSAKAYATGADG
jgi:hypothetical protein